MGVWFSCLTQTSAPVRAASSGQRCAGVGGMTAWTVSAAASMAARSGSMRDVSRGTWARRMAAGAAAGKGGKLAAETVPPAISTERSERRNLPAPVRDGYLRSAVPSGRLRSI